jgi:methylaspartate mutase sigma subunit
MSAVRIPAAHSVRITGDGIGERVLSSAVDGARPDSGLRIVVGTTVSDSHTWNLIFLQLLLEEWGHRVTNLGPCVPEEMLISRSAAIEPDLIVISTVNGHGFQDGRRLIDALRAHPRLSSVPTVIGGLLGIGQDDEQRAIAELLAAGYSAVFHNESELRRFRSVIDSLRAGVA